MMYFISGCKGTETVLQRGVIHITEMLQNYSILSFKYS
jgi:hypothetical protein